MEIILCPLRAHRPVVEEIDALLDVSMLERDASSDGEDLYVYGMKQAISSARDIWAVWGVSSLSAYHTGYTPSYN